MTPRTLKMVRLLLIFTILTSCASSVMATEAETPEPAPEAAATPAEEPVAEPVPLDCTTGELLERIDAWGVDCVALWLENLGFDDLKTAFMGNKVDGPALKLFTMEKLENDYGVSDEQQRKKPSGTPSGTPPRLKCAGCGAGCGCGGPIGMEHYL